MESICIIDVDVDHYKIILDYLLGVPSIGKINPIFFFGTIKPTIFAIYFDTFGGPRYAISESICIIYVDVDHYKNILDYLLGVLSIGKINPIFFCNN